MFRYTMSKELFYGNSLSWLESVFVNFSSKVGEAWLYVVGFDIFYLRNKHEVFFP